MTATNGTSRAAARRSALSGTAACLALLALAACSPLGKEPAAPMAQRPAEAPAKAPGPVAGPTPIPGRIIEIAGDCRRTEVDGYREEATMRIAANDVRVLTWRLWIAKRGTCAFDLADFRQTRSAPHIELTAADGSGCKLMVWQDPRRITLAHSNCERHCTPGAYDKAWPALFDPASGRCAHAH